MIAQGTYPTARPTATLPTSTLPIWPGREPHLLPAAGSNDPLRTAATTSVLVGAMPRPPQPVEVADHVVHVRPLVARPRPTFPIPPTGLIGREREIAACLALLRRPETRLLSVTGPAGVGKTRLALEIAVRLAAEDGAETVFVSLASIQDPALTLTTISHALGIPEDIGRGRLVALTERCRDRQLLLVLDNLEHVLGAAADLAALVAACPGLRILATSRAALRIRAERDYPLAPLPLPSGADLAPESLAGNPAVALFVERAAAVDPAFTLNHTNAPDIAAICARLDGLPLAIELAAARIGVLSPASLLRRLDHRFTLLKDGAGDLPARQRTMRDAVAWSYALLSAPDQALFRHLSIFPAGFTLSAAEAVSRETRDESRESKPRAHDSRLTTHGSVLDGVARLLGQSLVRRVEKGTEPRFAMLETIRAFGLEELAARGELDAAQAAHAAWALELAEGAEPELLGPRQREWHDLLAVEHDNLRAAIDWGLAPGADGERRGLALRLSAAIWRFWSARGHLREGYVRLTRGLDGAETVPAAVRAKALNNLGNVAYDLAKYGEARDRYEQSLALRTAIADHVGIAATSGNLGLVAMVEGDPEGAVEHFTESLRIRREEGDRAGIGVALGNLGDAWLALGDIARATACHEEAFAIFQDLGDLGSLGYSWYNLGEVARARRNLQGARGLYDRSLQVFREVDDQIGLGFALHGLGTIAGLDGRLRDAATELAESLAIGQAAADRQGILRSLEGLGEIAARIERPEIAVRLLAAAAAHRAALRQPVPVKARPERETLLGDLRAALPADQFDAAWAAGEVVSDDTLTALAAALGDATRDEQREVVTPPIPPATRDDAPATPRRGENPAGLSNREIEVLRLVSTGMTNAEVAASLFLSPRTVHAHLHRIYGKIGVSTRSGATRFAVEQDLV